MAVRDVAGPEETSAHLLGHRIELSAASVKVVFYTHAHRDTSQIPLVADCDMGQR
jgi:hypothetical protein